MGRLATKKPVDKVDDEVKSAKATKATTAKAVKAAKSTTAKAAKAKIAKTKAVKVAKSKKPLEEEPEEEVEVKKTPAKATKVTKTKTQKSKSKAVKSKKSPPDEDDEESVAEEEVVVKSKAKKTKKAKAAKAKSVVPVEDDEDVDGGDEEEGEDENEPEEEVEAPPVVAKKSKAAKAKSTNDDGKPKAVSKVVSKAAPKAVVINNDLEEVDVNDLTVIPPQDIPEPKQRFARKDERDDKTLIFKAVAVRGHILKIIIDTLHQPLPRGYLLIRKDGVYLRQSDASNTILFDIALERKNFASYKCKRDMTISINLKHLQKQLRSVKKKDQVSMWIDETEPEKLWFTVRSTREDSGASKHVQKVARVEVNFIVYKEEPEYIMTDLPDGKYQYPMVIDASEFSRIKRLTSAGKTVAVKMQRDNYISFMSDNISCFGSDITFGELKEEPDSEDEGDEGGYEVYEAQFFNAVFNLLVKLPGLCTQMQFYAPTVPHFPLKIAMTAAQSGLVLGTIQVYIKDVLQVNFEESLKGEQNVVVAPKTKKTKKTG